MGMVVLRGIFLRKPPVETSVTLQRVWGFFQTFGLKKMPWKCEGDLPAQFLVQSETNPYKRMMKSNGGIAFCWDNRAVSSATWCQGFLIHWIRYGCFFSMPANWQGVWNIHSTDKRSKKYPSKSLVFWMPPGGLFWGLTSDVPGWLVPFTCSHRTLLSNSPVQWSPKQHDISMKFHGKPNGLSPT